jgi:hypothetical protein
MSRTDWTGNAALSAFDDGREEGARETAQELADALRAAGLWFPVEFRTSRDNPRGQDAETFADIVTQWLDNHGIDIPSFVRPGRPYPGKT